MKNQTRIAPALTILAAVALLLVPFAVAGCQGAAPGRQASASRSTAAGDDEVLAIIDGVEVTIGDLDEGVGMQLGQMDFEYFSQRHQLIDSATRRYVREQLVEIEAADRGVSGDALIAELLDGKVNISDEDVQFFFLQNQAQLGGRAFEEVGPQIRQYLEGQVRDSVLEEFSEGLAAEGDVTYVLGPFRVDIDIDGDPSIGPDDAVVTVVEFSDFECPYCQLFGPTLEQIKTTYPDEVRVVFKQFPLRSIHPNAQAAAEAALCAHEQGKFWEAHDLFFAEQDSLTVADLKAKAGRLELDVDAFEACVSAGTYVQQIDDDMSEGTAVGVSGTPAIFVNGRPLPGGAVPFEMIQELIDDELENGGR